MAKNKPARRRQDSPRREKPLGTRVRDVCAKCGGALIAGVCGVCMITAMPAGAGPAPAALEPTVMACLPSAQQHPAPITAPPNVVELAPSQQVPHYVPLANLEGLAAPPIGRPEDPHPPEPDATFYTPGIFGGTAVTGQPAPRGRGGWWWTPPA